MLENTVNPSSSKQLYRQDLGLYIKDSGIYWNVFHLRWTCRLMKKESLQHTQQRIIRYRRGCCCCCCCCCCFCCSCSSCQFGLYTSCTTLLLHIENRTWSLLVCCTTFDCVTSDSSSSSRDLSSAVHICICSSRKYRGKSTKGYFPFETN